MCSRVARRPYLSTALLPALKLSPNPDEVSDSIWCLKNSPNFFSKCDIAAFLGMPDDEEEGTDDEDDDDVDATWLPAPDMISDLRSHMWARTWHMPSSTSRVEILKPEKEHNCGDQLWFKIS